MPCDWKAIPYDPFRNYPDTPVSDLPFDLPVEYRKQLISLLPHLPATASVSNLVNSHRDMSGNMVHGMPVVNRPWEWIENLGDPVVSDPKDEGREREEKHRSGAKYLVKNSGSLSLDTFGAHMTGDGVLRDLEQEDDSTSEANLRAFEDGLSAENIFKRDWRETRVELDANVMAIPTVGRQGGEMDFDASGTSLQSSILRPDKRTTPRGSPASSVVSRTSARGSVGSAKQSPGQGSNHRQSNSTISDTIDVDSVTTNSSNRPSGNKRKAAAAIAVSDDEIEIIEGPVPARINKKPKVKAPTKARAKKK